MECDRFDPDRQCWLVGRDLEEAGLAESLPRPGRNVTDLTTFDRELTGKQLELLKELVPCASRLAALWVGALPAFARDVYAQAPQRLDVQLHIMEVQEAGQLDDAFAAIPRERVAGLDVQAHPLTTQHRAGIAELALAHRLPTISESRLFPDAGCLMAYQLSLSEHWRRTAYFVDRILKGANPAALPVERPMVFDFVVNVRTAEALGLTLPPHVQAQATEVLW